MLLHKQFKIQNAEKPITKSECKKIIETALKNHFPVGKTKTIKFKG